MCCSTNVNICKFIHVDTLPLSALMHAFSDYSHMNIIIITICWRRDGANKKDVIHDKNYLKAIRM